MSLFCYSQFHMNIVILEIKINEKMSHILVFDNLRDLAADSKGSIGTLSEHNSPFDGWVYEKLI